MMNQKIELTGWEVSGYFPYVPQLGMLEPDLGRSITDWIPAHVPGSVHADLYRAGWISDPYFGMNSMQCEWVENRWWAYRCAVDVRPRPGQRCHLRFDGLDYKCRIYLDQTLLLLHEGSFTPVDLDVTDRLTGQPMELLIVFESAPDEESQAGHASHTHTQKSRFSYKWDFGTRMVPVGIWCDAWIELTGAAAIGHVRLMTAMQGAGGTLHIAAECLHAEGYALHAAIRRGGSTLAACTLPCQPLTEAVLTLPEIDLWQPNGMGEQALYQVDLTLVRDGETSHAWHGRVGFRDLQWVRNDGAPADALPYCLMVNGRRMYVKGVNITPFDMLIGTVTPERYRSFLTQMQAAHINFVRVNGVGLIEKECFYDLCDELGILVWQEFIQTSSSMDRMPPTDPAYLKLLGETSLAAIRVKRNHACLACWCGGNELTDAPGVPATYGNANIACLRSLIDAEDPGRMLFPGSASGPKEFLDFHPRDVMHDVHGPWHYVPQEHYALFNQSDSLFHGELGAEGMAAVESLRRFLAPCDLTVTDMQRNLVWRHHGDWWDTCARDRALTGTPDDLDAFVRISQLFQAEGIRYALASNRRRKFRNSGSLMWAYNEPYPNVSNTSLVDYYGVVKLAWYAAREAWQPLLMSLQYDKQVFAPGETLRASAWLNSSLPEDTGVRWDMTLLSLTGQTLWQQAGETHLPAGSALHAADLAIPITAAFPEVLLLRLQYNTCVSEYLFSTRAETPFAALLRLDARLAWRETAPQTYLVTNTGSQAALFVAPDLDGDSAFVHSPDGAPCLMPGESRVLHVTSASGGRDWRRVRFVPSTGLTD